MPKIVILWSDVVVIATLLLLLLYACRVRASKNLRATWAQVGRDPAALCSAVVLVLFFAVAVVDSLHFRRALANTATAKKSTSTTDEQIAARSRSTFIQVARRVGLPWMRQA